MEKQLLQDIIEWDVSSWSQPLLFWENAVPWDEDSRAVFGDRRAGGLSLWLCSKGMDVVCSDLRWTEATASALHKKYNVFSQMHYLDLDATNIPFENHFDIIAFKSVLGAVGYDAAKDRQQQAVDEILKA